MMIALTLVAAVVPSAAVGQTPAVNELTLENAIQMALENNLDIVVARLDTQAQGESVAAARGAYKPQIGAVLNNYESVSPAGSQLIGAEKLERSTAAYNFSWEQLIPSGGGYSISFENSRAKTNSIFTSFNPLFNSGINASVRQPLLKDLGLHSARQQVVVAQNTERVSRHQFETRVMDVVRQVQDGYWDLVYSIRELEVSRSSLQLAEDLLRNNSIQVEVGTMAPIDVLEAEAEVAARTEAVIRSEEAILRYEDILKRLINDPESEDFWSMEITPVDQPTRASMAIDLEDSVRVGLQRRPELFESRAVMDTRSYNVRYTRNQLLPQVDLVGSIAFNGLGGNQLLRQDFMSDEFETIPGGYSDALDQLIGGDFRDWALGLNVSYPLGNSTADAAHARAQVQFRQQRAAIESQELLIAQQIRVTARLVDTNQKRMEATRVARELAERRLDAEEKKFEVGMSTSFLIVQAQRDLALADANELRAIIDYNKALVAFERARGTLLDEVNITVR